MFRFLANGVKLVVFGIFVLAMGSVVEWKGKSISRRVEEAVSSAEQSKIWASTRHTVSGAAREVSRSMGIKGEIPSTLGRPAPSGDQIAVTERAKLRELIRDLNSANR